ncbi:hypothetical protein [Desulfamplus magnetovallimortis]|nr:hypothetical protein [Desulfamplus magnetovallimortis]
MENRKAGDYGKTSPQGANFIGGVPNMLMSSSQTLIQQSFHKKISTLL